MALWTGLGQGATVAQLVGVDLVGLTSKIIQASRTVRQNRTECEQLARQAFTISELLSDVQDPEAAQPLARLGDTLRDAHDLIVSCQGRSPAYEYVTADTTAERLREVQNKINFHLILFPLVSNIGVTRRLQEIHNILIPLQQSSQLQRENSRPLYQLMQTAFDYCHIGITCRLGRIYNILVQDDPTRGEPSPLPQSSQLQESTEVAQEVVPHGTHEFTWDEIVAATNNFDTVIGSGMSGLVYRGRLNDGRQVAVKRAGNNRQLQDLKEEFHTELDILSRLRHKHIVCLLGSCVSKDEGLLTRLIKAPERLIVYEYMENGTLFNHLHRDQGGSSALSPVTLSWKMRIDVLLGVSRGIEHLHCHANPSIIHRDIKSNNILLDENWVPRLSDFGLSVVWDIVSEESELKVSHIIGTHGCMAPEYCLAGRLNPASDMYSLGVLMLQVLTGRTAFFQGEEGTNVGLTSFAVPIIEAGNIGGLLDRRPVPELTSWQLQALKRVAQIARCCVELDWKNRPAISDIVANLETAHELICKDEPFSVDEPGLWPFLQQVDEFHELPDSPCASSSDVSLLAGYQSDQELDALEEGRWTSGGDGSRAAWAIALGLVAIVFSSFFIKVYHSSLA